MEAMVHEMEDNHKEEKEMWELERAASASEVATARAQLTQMEAALRSSRAGRLLVDKPALPEWAPEEGEEEEEEVRAAPEPAPEETTDESNVGEDYLASNGASASCLSAAAPAAASPPPVVASVAEKELNVAQAESSLETAATTPSATRRTMAATPSATRRTMAATPSAARPTMAATPSATRPMAAATPSTARPKEEATHEGLLSALKMAQSELRVMTCRCKGLEQEMQQMRRGQGLDSETASRRIQEAKERARLMEKSILERVKQCDAEELEDSKQMDSAIEDGDIFGSSSRASQFKAAVAMLQRQGMFGDDPEDASPAPEVAGGRRSMQARDEPADSQFRNALASLNKQGISNESTPQRADQEDEASENGNGAEEKKQPPARLGNRLSIFETPPPAPATGEPEESLPGSGSASRPGKIKILDKFLPKEEERSPAIGESPPVNSQPGKIKILDKFLPKEEEEVVPLARHPEGQRNRATSQFKESMSKLFSSGEEVAADGTSEASNGEAKPAVAELTADEKECGDDGEEESTPKCEAMPAVANPGADENACVDVGEDETTLESEAKPAVANPGADENECVDAGEDETIPESEAKLVNDPVPEQEESSKEAEEVSAVNEEECSNEATTAPAVDESGSVQAPTEEDSMGEQEVLTSPSKEWVQVGRTDGTLEEEEAQL
ncbi:hypothetical protein CYMTET_9686 [Cymbomonas tetramitiformis]|uniref:Uncharacterized protein n=1 Tax=Cymbomonas tetramitiformis TaxID=36881 RepID=A0AAE0GQT6_9CHLO|nr:hypothetical protein CYMTET_9686 [Cymbomonas tetramitiformis]